MDPELDAEIDQLLAAPTHRARQRRTVLGTTTIEAGGPTTYDPSGEREEIGPEIEVADEYTPVPVPVSPDEKEAPDEVTSQQRQEWRRRELAPEVASTSAAWDAILGGAPGTGREGDRAAERSRERLHSLWDQIVSGDERLGGRNPIAPMVGRDLRGEAPTFGAMRTVGIVPRDAELRQREATARAQAPEAFTAGQVAAMPAWLAAPQIGATAPQRIAAGAIMGAAGGGLEAEAGGGDATDIARDAAVGGVIGGGASALAEGASALLNPRRPADALARSAERTQRTADQARLEASGVWGGRAMREADALPGGQEALAADLRRYGIGERGPGQAGFSPNPPPRGLTIPRMARAAEDAEALRRASGSGLETLAQSVDQTGEQVSTLGVRRRVEDLARELDRLPIGGTDAAGRLRQLTQDLAQGGDLSFSDAWAQRQLLDDMIGGFQRDPNLASLTGRLQAVRDALSAEMGNTAGRAGLGSAWSRASRDYQVGAFMRDFGRGGERLSVGGGMGGANATGDLVAQAVMTGSPMQVAASVPRSMAARALSQETRMAFPGVRARVGETSAAVQRSAADALYQLAQRQPQALGRLAHPILEAGARGSAALLTTIHTLAQRDAEARRIMEEAQGLDQQE